MQAKKASVQTPRDDNARSTATKRRHPVRSFALRAGAGAVVVSLLLWHYDARPIFVQLSHERLLFFFATISLYVAGQFLSSWRWSLLGKMLKIPAPYTDYVTFTFIGMFTNVFVPGLVGGDAARAIYLGRRYRRLGDAVASVITDRSLGMVGLFWLAAAASVGLGLKVTASVRGPTIAIGVISFVGWVALPMVGRLARRMPARIALIAKTVDPYLNRPLALLLPIGLSVALQFSLAVGQWILALGLGLHVPLTLFILCVPIANLFASLPLTLNGLGVRETTYLMLFGMAGMGTADAIALGLLWFAATALGNLTGVIAFALTETAPISEPEQEPA